MTVRRGVALLGALLLTGCALRAPATTTPRPTDAGAVNLDVTTYRGDAARTGAMPGPGPAGDPAIAWTFEADGPIRTSPLVVGDTVVLVDEAGLVHAIALGTGEERWSVDLEADIGGTPVAHRDVVIVGNDLGALAAIELATGAERWTAALDGPIRGSPAIVGERIVAGTTIGTAYGMDAATGAVAWSAPFGAAITKSVAISGDTAYLGLTGGELVAVGSADGSARWRATLATMGEIGTPTVAGGLVYVATGIDGVEPSARTMTAVDALSAEVRWRYASPSHNQPYTAAVVDGRAYIVAEDGRVVALNGTTGTSIWSVATESSIDALPSVAEGVVYVAGIGGPVSALDAATGEARWTVPIMGTPFAPVITGGYLLVGTSVGRLYAIGGPAR